MTARKRTLFALAILFVFCGILAAQIKTQDVLYLKNGSIIRGLIIELIPDKSVKIQTADGNVFIFSMEDVDKIQRVERFKTAEVKKAPERQKEPSNNISSIVGGLSLPLGEFSDVNSNLGGAKLGFTIGFQVHSKNKIGLLLNFSYTANPSRYTGSWSTFLAVAGLKATLTQVNNTDIYVAPLLGLYYGKTPDLGYTGNGAAIAFGVCLGAQLSDRAGLVLRIVAADPEFKFGSAGSIPQSFSIANLMFAIGL